MSVGGVLADAAWLLVGLSIGAMAATGWSALRTGPGPAPAADQAEHTLSTLAIRWVLSGAAAQAIATALGATAPVGPAVAAAAAAVALAAGVGYTAWIGGAR